MTERLHFHFYALEKEMATHSSVLAWRIPGMGLHRVGHDRSDLAAVAAEGWVEALQVLKGISRRENSLCKALGVMKGPGHLDSGEKSDVAKIQSKLNGVGLGDETRSDRSLKFISSHWLCEPLILEIPDETYLLIIFFSDFG